MKKLLPFNILLLVLFSAKVFSQWTNTASLYGVENSSERYGRAVSLSADGTVMAVGAFRDGEVYDDNENLDQRGTVRIYEKSENEWNLTTAITSNEIGANFGRALQLTPDGNTIIIGAPNAGDGFIEEFEFFNDISTTETGFIAVYTKDASNNWNQVGENIVGETAGEYFGWSVGISDDGNTLASGAYRFNNETGITRVYKKIAGDRDSWEKTIEFNGINEGQRTGYSLSLSGNGNTLAIGADKFDEEKGSTDVYQNNGNDNWTAIGLSIIGETDGENSGASVSISQDGNILAIGAHNYNNSQGTVRFYKNENDSWIKTSQIDGEEGSEDNFGNQLYMTSNANTIAISATSYDFSNGLTRVFTQNNDASWSQKGTDILSGANAFDFVFFGTAVSLSSDGNTASIGAYAYNNSGGFTNDGAVLVFEFSEASLSTDNISFDDTITFSIQNNSIVTSSQDISLSIYDFLGRKTVNKNLNGSYIVNFVNQKNGKITTKKLYIK